MRYGDEWWQAVRDLTAYAEFLRRGGNEDSLPAVRLRGLAFPEGANLTTLDAMHAELARPPAPRVNRNRKREVLHSPARPRRRQRKRESPSERRRRLAAEALAV